jgi:uncharacterized protein YbjT (DUF2867 family)
MRVPDAPVASPPRRVGIIGATGYIGGRLVPRLLDAGYAVRALARSPGKLREQVFADQIEIQEISLDDPASVARGLAGCDAVYYLVHSMVWTKREVAEVDRRRAGVVAEAAREAGVGWILYLTGMAETDPARREVERALASTGVPLTVFRAAMIIGSGSAPFVILRALVQRLPVMVTPRWVDIPCQPIAVRNVMGYLVGALAVPETRGASFDIGGADVMTHRQIIQVMAAELGLRPRWIVPVPVRSPRLSALWIQLVTPLHRAVARPLVEGLRQPLVCRENRITALVPQPLFGVRQAIHAALGRMSEGPIETTWSMAGAIPGSLDWTGGPVFRDERELSIAAPPSTVFQAVCRAGGGHGWFAADWLWQLRGWLDVLAGGPGLRRGRRDPERIGYGEALDFWRVVGIDRDRELVLRAEMKLPGEAILAFTIEPRGPAGCTLRQTALFRARGWPGRLYWYAVAPFHSIVFRGMLKGIAREAEEIGSTRGGPALPTAAV